MDVQVNFAIVVTSTIDIVNLVSELYYLYKDCLCIIDFLTKYRKIYLNHQNRR